VLPVAEKHLRDILENADLAPRVIERAAEQAPAPA
ncbi:lipoate-protein ligase B, partial [Streptomyces cavourensis]